MENNTIFDDVFRTMLEKMPRLVIPVINEVFHTSYSEDEKINQYRNEHHTKSGEIITDSYLGIGDKLYHLECESSSRGNMGIRMIEYDFAAALEGAALAEDMFEINFPHSCVLYLRHNQNTPDYLKVKINMPDGQHVIYSIPTVKLQEYTKDDIFKKRLLFFLPFYIMRYEKEVAAIGADPEKTDSLVQEFESIARELKRELSSDEEMDLYTRLEELMERVADYILDSEGNLKERIGDIMGGKVLELETDKILELGRKQGIEQGIEQGLERGLEQGIEQEKYKTIKNILMNSDFSTREIAMFTGYPEEDILSVHKQMQENMEEDCPIRKTSPQRR